MTNEALFVGVLLGGLLAGVAAAWRGRAWVEALVIVLTLYINLAEPKIIAVFGLPTTLSTALYGVIFFLTDILGERWGRAAAFTAVRRAIVASIAFQLLLQLTRIAIPIEDAAGVAVAMEEVFAFSLRIAAASLVVYTLSQSLDVWLFHRIRAWTAGRHLWLRNTASTAVSQGVDSFAFAFLAFYEAYEDWAAIALVGYGFKLAVTAADTGFLYVARAIPASENQRETGASTGCGSASRM